MPISSSENLGRISSNRSRQDILSNLFICSRFCIESKGYGILFFMNVPSTLQNSPQVLLNMSSCLWRLVSMTARPETIPLRKILKITHLLVVRQVPLALFGRERAQIQRPSLALSDNPIVFQPVQRHLAVDMWHLPVNPGATHFVVESIHRAVPRPSADAIPSFQQERLEPCAKVEISTQDQETQAPHTALSLSLLLTLCGEISCSNETTIACPNDYSIEDMLRTSSGEVLLRRDYTDGGNALLPSLRRGPTKPISRGHGDASSVWRG